MDQQLRQELSETYQRYMFWKRLACASIGFIIGGAASLWLTT